MDAVIYNSLSRRKETFVPIVPGTVKMYCCGPTVYDFLHVGNFRGPVFFNFVRNWLEHSGLQVTFALNFTDIDDKILDRARQEGVDPRRLAARYVEEYKTDYASLGLRPHDINPKVTDSIDDIIAFIVQLITKNFAYATSSGNVYFSVQHFQDYGKLSGRNIEDQLSGARIENESDKREPQDFALWKNAAPDEESWKSPWGQGRPGWHIECSAMVHRHLGPMIDIHGGGSDLKFPHHENEIAQSEAHNGGTFAKYWMHHQMFTFGGQKMSKSLGNLIRMREFLGEWHPEIYKQLVLSHHYRSSAEFSQRTIYDAILQLNKVYSALATADYFLAQAVGRELAPKSDLDASLHQFASKATEALNDDFNTPAFFGALHDLLHEFNKRVHRGLPLNDKVIANCQSFVTQLKTFSQLLALYGEQPQEFLTMLTEVLLREKGLSRNEVQALVDQRNQARVQKDFTRSDQLRQQLTDMSIALQDGANSTHWEVKAEVKPVTAAPES